MDLGSRAAGGRRRAGAVTVGEALVAFEPVEGRLASASALALQAVGAELNYAIDLARLDVPAQFFGGVGDDPHGGRIRRAAGAEGVDVSGVTVHPSAPTGLMFKEPAGLDGERVTHYLRSGSAGSQFSPTPELLAAAASAGAVHVSGISFCLGAPLRRSATALLQQAGPAAWRSFDLNVRLRLAPPRRWRSVLLSVLPLVSTVFATEDELAVCGLGAEQLATIARRHHCVCVIRRGRQPTLVTCPDGNEEEVSAVYAVAPVDPVGSGDAFAAATTAWRLEGRSWRESVEAGHVAGALVASLRGDVEGAPSASELRAQLAGTRVTR